MSRGGFGVGFVFTLLIVFSSVAIAADSPLADAAEKGDRALVGSLLDRLVDVNQSQVDGMTALHWATHRDDLEMAKALVAAKADVRLANRYGVTPLAMACTNGNGPMVEVLLGAGADPDSKLPGDESALMTASRTGKIGPVKALLARGAAVNARDLRGQSALMWAASEGNVEVVETLLRAGAEFRTALTSGFTPLFFAVREGKIDATRALLKAGADVNQAMQPRKTPGGKSPNRGTTPLVLAVENGHFDLAVVLLEAGADPNDQRSGYTPLHMLTWVRKPNRGDGDDGDPPPIGSGHLTSLEFVAKLAEHKANINARLDRGPSGKGILNRTGATTFLLASQTADLPLMEALIQLGADPSIGNIDRATPLMAASGLGCLAPSEEAGTEDEAIEAVKLLLKLGGDVNHVDGNGETAMHGAAYKSFPRVVRLLDDSGARPEIWDRKNKYGWTPMAIAEGNRPGNFKPSAETIDSLKRVLARK